MTHALSPAYCAILVACAVESPHDREFVSQQIADRGGVTTRPETTTEQMPPGTLLADGLTEPEAVAIALWNNPGFQAALTDLDVSRAELAEAGAFKNPALSVLFPLGPKQLELTVEFPLDALLHRPHRVLIARIEVERVAAQLVRSGLDLIRDTQLAFGAVVYAKQQVALAERTAALAVRRAQLARSRARVGEIGEHEAQAANAVAARAAADTTKARGEEALAVLQLLGQLGLPPETAAPVLVAEIEPATPPPVAELEKIALAARPDLRAAELVVEAAGERVGLTKAEVWQIGLLADIDGVTGDTDQVGPGLVMEVPVFNQRGGAIAKADAEVKRSVARLAALRANVVQNLRQCWQREDALRKELEELQRSAVPASEREMAGATHVVAAGEEGEDVMLAAREHELQLQHQVADATTALHDARVQLVHAVGRRLTP